MDDRQRYSQWESGEGYNRYITAELTSFRKTAWQRQILQRFDAGRRERSEASWGDMRSGA